MSTRNVAIALAALLLAAPAGAQIVVTAPDRDAEDRRVVCKNERATGTRLAKKSCRTVKQWAEMREQHIRDMKEATGPGIQSNSSNPGVPN